MYSKPYEQETGVPQGSILSVTLFCLKINSVVKELSASVTCSLEVDDFLICYRSKHIHIVERHLQQPLNKIDHWANTNGFRFLSSKTACIHFCHSRKPHPEPTLILYGTAVPVVQEVKFLGLIFNNQLSFLPHVDRLSIFTAELYAIVLVYGLVYRKPCKQLIVFYDSLSALQAIKNFDVDNRLVMHIVSEHSRLERSGKHVELCWIPSHIGITGNEKSALSQQITYSKLPATDFYPSISQHCSSEWQVSWDSCTSNKSHAIIPVVVSNVMKNSLNHCDSSVMNRGQLG